MKIGGQVYRFMPINQQRLISAKTENNVYTHSGTIRTNSKIIERGDLLC